MTIKSSRALPHSKPLKDPEEWTKRMEEGLLALGDKMAVWLVQPPPNFSCNMERLTTFLEQVPPWIKLTVEFRHPSWKQEEVFALLEKHGVAYCIMSGANPPCLLRATAPFVYVRLHGPDDSHFYARSYSDDALRWRAEHIREWHEEGNVWAYFNNDGSDHGVHKADNPQTLPRPLKRPNHFRQSESVREVI